MFNDIIYINHGNATFDDAIVVNYEDSKIDNKDRTIDSFVEWVKLKSGKDNISNSEREKYIPNKTHKKRYTKRQLGGSRRKRGGKWSLKYKNRGTIKI